MVIQISRNAFSLSQQYPGILPEVVISAPFAYYHQHVSHEAMVHSSWLGHVETKDIGVWVDGLLLLIFGGIPWQGYFQRVLAIRTTKMAQQTALWAMVGCLLMGIPALLFGVIARGTDWTHVDGFDRNMTLNDSNVILPRVLRHLTPQFRIYMGAAKTNVSLTSGQPNEWHNTNHLLGSSAMVGIFTNNRGVNYRIQQHTLVASEEGFSPLRTRSFKIALVLKGPFRCFLEGQDILDGLSEGTPPTTTVISRSRRPIKLPLLTRISTFAWVSFFGLGSVSAAVMSSADSSILASAAMFTRNIYKWTFRPSASEKEVVWVMRITTIIISYLSAGIAISVGSIYYLSYLCSDLVYVILFPQLLLIVHWSRGVTTYGCLASYIVGLSLRVLGGEKDIGLEPVISYPYFDSETNTQGFPFRTFAMICAIVTHVTVSCISRWLFESGTLSADRWDVLMAFPECHLTRTDHREHRYKDPNKGRTNKALHDAVVGKRLSQASEGLLSGNDDDSLLMKRDRSELTNQASVSSETPSVSKF
ncbi:hypothetical protein J6590_054342 [Homalodisca vitripennis]|nr:hypothetical protein J6590_054342 [Homalodisca vitripennis]